MQGFSIQILVSTQLNPSHHGYRPTNTDYSAIRVIQALLCICDPLFCYQADSTICDLLFCYQGDSTICDPLRIFCLRRPWWWKRLK